MPEIIQIDPEPRHFSITWMLGSRCNYECMYCPKELHDNTSTHHDLDTLKRAWIKIIEKSQYLNLDYKISFTGGEVTTNRHFLPFLSWIKQQSYQTLIFVTTNGSASLSYYRRMAQLVNGISMSTHSEYMDEMKFFNTARQLNKMMIRPEKSLHVNIMDEHWNQERIILYKQFCENHQISYVINTINYSRQTRSVIFDKGKKNLA